MDEVLIATVAALIVLPHLLPLHRIAPASAAAAWLAALALRAISALALVAVALTHLPQTASFGELTISTLHSPLPDPIPHVDLAGDFVAHAGVLAPAVLVACSVLAFVAVTAFTALRLRAAVARRAADRQPGDVAIVISDPNVILGIPTVGPSLPIVSDAAIAALDETELEAGLAHERGHLQRGHRPLGLAAGALAAIARPLPGTRAAERGLRLSLERDADEHAIRSGADPLALGSAICKAATTGPRNGVFALGGHSATQTRLDQLLDGGVVRAARPTEALAVVFTVAVAAIALAVVATTAQAVVPVGGVSLAVACPS